MKQTSTKKTHIAGSGIETQSHLEENGRITLMLLAFEGGPRIMRLIGRGRVVRLGSPEYNDIVSTHYQNEESQPVANSSGRRGIIMVDVRKVGTSCGYSVPYFDYKGPRPTLINAFAKKDDDAITDMWRAHNAVSLDGLPGMRHERMGPEWLGSNHRTALTLDENNVGYEADGSGGSGSLLSLGGSKNWVALIAPRLLVDLVILTTGICIGILVTRRR